MAIDLETIAVSALSAVVTSGIVVFAAKHFISRLIDSRIKRADEEYILKLNEDQRRRRELYDQQAEALDSLTSLVYQIRDAARQVRDDDNRKNLRDVEARLRAIVKKYEEGLFAARAVLPDTVFRVIHEIRTPIALMFNLLEHMKRALPERRQEIRQRIESCIQVIEAVYQAVVPVVHEHRGVSAGARDEEDI